MFLSSFLLIGLVALITRRYPNYLPITQILSCEWYNKLQSGSDDVLKRYIILRIFRILYAMQSYAHNFAILARFGVLVWAYVEVYDGFIKQSFRHRSRADRRRSWIGVRDYRWHVDCGRSLGWQLCRCLLLRGFERWYFKYISNSIFGCC
jgi:hypothetical protein